MGMKLEIMRRKLAQFDEVLDAERSFNLQMKRMRELDMMCERKIGCVDTINLIGSNG